MIPPMIPRPRISPPAKEEVLQAETLRLREAICAIVEARDQGNFDAMMAAIESAGAEATLSALRAAGER